MALLFNRNLKWNIHINLQSIHRTHSSHSLQGISQMKRTSEFFQYGSFERIERLWESFIATPYKWYDYRMNKRNDKAPDFKHIETGEVLWIVSHKTPDWVNSKLSYLERGAFAASQSLEQLWISFFADPSKWFDHRKIKKSDSHPDFVHKYTFEALWIKGNQVPIWVVPTLKSLSDDKFETSPTRIHMWQMFFADSSQWFDNRKIKKKNTHPDFVHKNTLKGLWIGDNKNPTWVTNMLKNLQDGSFAPFPSLENLWKSFFANPSNWLDYRKNKKSKKFPDFKHKESGQPLWIDSKGTPSWVLPKLNGLHAEASSSSSSLEDLWISFSLDQSKWIDYRGIKKSNMYPDFLHKDTSEALWVDSTDTPAWATLMLNNLQYKSFAHSLSIENLWKALFDDPSKWFDNRSDKKSNKSPDFKHKNTREALWIDDKRTPAWVLSKLKNLPFGVFACQDKIRASHEGKWKAFFASPSNWFDNRSSKITQNTPDFRHKKNNQALWIACKFTPDWIVPSLEKLENAAFTSPNANESMGFFVDISKRLDVTSKKEKHKV